MPGTAGPRLGLVWGYAPGEVGWGVGGYNPNFARLEALVHLTVIAVSATPPTTPANGDCYIVAASPTGAWVGHADDIAVYYTSGGWLYIDPAVGIRAFDRSGDTYIRFDGVDWIDEIVPAADVSGPAGVVDGNVTIFDGATGKVIKDGGKALPTGLIVGTTDVQILEHKVIDGAANSLVVHLDTDVAGNLGVAHLGGGVGASNTTVFYGDGTWRVPGSDGGGGASITVSDTPPASPAVGQMWFDSASACLYVWYEDSTAGAWVVAVNVGSGSGGAGVLSISATGPLSVSASVGDVELSLSTVPIGSGGTNSTSAPAALTALGAFPAAGGTITGQVTVSTTASDPHRVTVTAGNYGRSVYTVTGARAWSVGTVPSGTFQIADETAAVGRLSIDAAGATSVARTLAVGNVPAAGADVGTVFADLQVVGKFFGSNAYYNGDWKYWKSGQQANVWVMDGENTLYAAPGGTADAVIPFAARVIFKNTDDTCLNTTGSWAVFSDLSMKVKETLRPYERGLAALLELNPVTFQYAAGTPFATADEPSRPLVGLIASEVEPHIPEMCGITTVTIHDESKEVQTINPGDLTYVLINAIKELEARVRELEERPPNPPEALPA
jgi:hypothetical protein